MGAIIKPVHDAAAHDLLWWLLFVCHATVVCCPVKKLKMLFAIKIETPDTEDSSSILVVFLYFSSFDCGPTYKPLKYIIQQTRVLFVSHYFKFNICIFMFRLHLVHCHYLNCLQLILIMWSTKQSIHLFFPNNLQCLAIVVFFFPFFCLFPPSISRIKLCWGILRQTLPRLFWYQSSEAEGGMLSEVDMEEEEGLPLF